MLTVSILTPCGKESRDLFWEERMSDQGERCEFCWHPPQLDDNGGLHHNGCPAVNLEVMDKWREGFAFGANDNIIEWWQNRFYPPAFILGWRAGKDWIDALVDLAAQSRC